MQYAHTIASTAGTTAHSRFSAWAVPASVPTYELYSSRSGTSQAAPDTIAATVTTLSILHAPHPPSAKVVVAQIADITTPADRAIPLPGQSRCDIVVRTRPRGHRVKHRGGVDWQGSLKLRPSVSKARGFHEESSVRVFPIYYAGLVRPALSLRELIIPIVLLSLPLRPCIFFLPYNTSQVYT